MKQTLVLTIALAALALLAAAFWQQHRRLHWPQLTTPHQLVTLVNGSTYVGRIAHLGSDHPVLRAAATLRIDPDAAGGPPRVTVLPRKQQPHGGDHMILPATSILSVEPIQPESAVGRAIASSGG